MILLLVLAPIIIHTQCYNVSNLDVIDSGEKTHSQTGKTTEY